MLIEIKFKIAHTHIYLPKYIQKFDNIYEHK